jgi:hypothetical protein
MPNMILKIVFVSINPPLILKLLLYFFNSCSNGFAGLASLAKACERLHTTGWRLGEGGGFTAVRTGANVENSHKISSEPRPRLRQTAR